MNPSNNFLSQMQAQLQDASPFSPQTLQICSLALMACTLLLFIFQIYTVAHCMLRPVPQFPAPSDRVVWGVLAFLVPLGIGAWLYHGVTRFRWFHPFFWIPFLVYVAVQIYLFMIWGNFNFKLNFLNF